MPFPIVAAILAASAIASSAVAARSAKKQRDLAKSESELAYQREVELIDKQNQYNSPASQMERWKDAGLNPNLMYSQGSPGNQQSVASYQPSRETGFSPIAIPEVLGMYQDFQMKQAQVDAVRASTENTHQKTMNEAMRNYILQLQGKGLDLDVSQKEYLQPYQAAIVGNQARASEAKLDQEWLKVINMAQGNQMQLLEQQYKKKAMTAVDLDNEKREADILYKKYQNEWMKHGITSSDNIILRILTRMLNDTGFQGEIRGLLEK